MKSSFEERRAFDAGLAEFMTYVWKLEAGEEKYSGQKLKAIIESFAPAMHEHMVNEIPALLALGKYSEKVDWGEYWKKKAAEIFAKKSADPTTKVRTFVAFVAGDMKREKRVAMSRIMANKTWKVIMLPFVLTCTDATFEGSVYQWRPNFPWIAKMVTRYYYFPQHGNWWRFGPVDSAGQPRELPFAKAAYIGVIMGVPI